MRIWENRNTLFPSKKKKTVYYLTEQKRSEPVGNYSGGQAGEKENKRLARNQPDESEVEMVAFSNPSKRSLFKKW